MVDVHWKIRDPDGNIHEFDGPDDEVAAREEVSRRRAADIRREYLQMPHLQRIPQYADDLMRNIANSLTFGGTDRLAAGLDTPPEGWEGTPHEYEKDLTWKSRQRLGLPGAIGADIVGTLPIAKYIPSIALKGAEWLGGPKWLQTVVEGALASGETAGLSASQAVVEDEDPWEAAATGAKAGPLGMLAGKAVGAGARRLAASRFGKYVLLGKKTIPPNPPRRPEQAAKEVAQDTELETAGAATPPPTPPAGMPGPPVAPPVAAAPPAPPVVAPTPPVGPPAGPLAKPAGPSQELLAARRKAFKAQEALDAAQKQLKGIKDERGKANMRTKIKYLQGAKTSANHKLKQLEDAASAVPETKAAQDTALETAGAAPPKSPLTNPAAYDPNAPKAFQFGGKTYSGGAEAHYDAIDDFLEKNGYKPADQGGLDEAVKKFPGLENIDERNFGVLDPHGNFVPAYSRLGRSAKEEGVSVSDLIGDPNKAEAGFAKIDAQRAAEKAAPEPPAGPPVGVLAEESVRDPMAEIRQRSEEINRALATGKTPAGSKLSQAERAALGKEMKDLKVQAANIKLQQTAESATAPAEAAVDPVAKAVENHRAALETLDKARANAQKVAGRNATVRAQSVANNTLHEAADAARKTMAALKEAQKAAGVVPTAEEAVAAVTPRKAAAGAPAGPLSADKVLPEPNQPGVNKKTGKPVSTAEPNFAAAKGPTKAGKKQKKKAGATAADQRQETVDAVIRADQNARLAASGPDTRGYDSEIAKRFKSILSKQKYRDHLTKDEMETLKRTIRGDPAMKTGRVLGRLASPISLANTTLGSSAAWMFGVDPLAIASGIGLVGGGGLLGRTVASGGAKRLAKEAIDTIRGVQPKAPVLDPKRQEQIYNILRMLGR